MTPAQQTLTVIRTLTALWYFAWALLDFAMVAWLAGPVGHWWWPVIVLAMLLALPGVQWVRLGCEQLVTNETQRAQGRNRNDSR